MKRNQAIRIGFVLLFILTVFGAGTVIFRKQGKIREMTKETESLREELDAAEEETEKLRSELQRMKEPAKGGFQKIARGQDIRLLIVGDSIGAGAGAEEEEGFESLLVSWLREKYGIRCEAENVSMGGNTSYAGYVRVMMLPEDAGFDLAIVCCGYNDGIGDFSRDYEAILRSIRARCPRCAIVSVLQSPERGETEKVRQTRQLAAHYGIPIADTLAAFAESGKDYEELTTDLVHPNPEGYGLYAKCLENLIEDKVKQYAEVSDAPIEPVNSDMEEYEHFYYIPAKEGRVSDDGCEMEIPFSAVLCGKPGIELLLHPGEKPEIYTDGIRTEYREFHWNEDYTLHRIDRLSADPWRIEESLRLVFSSPEEAEDFRGLVFTAVE